MKNIYFTFVYLLRAAQKASTFLSNYDYFTSHPDEDQRVQSLMKSFISSSLDCSSTFDETSLFQGERASLKKDFMAKFRNISEIMDCVSCQTCKVHAKLQILGIATATKILITDDPKIVQGLQHNEISALVNTLFKFSESIQIMHTMKEREDKYLKEKAEQSGEQEATPEAPQSEEQKKGDEEGHLPHQHFSIYALIAAVVLITIGALYSSHSTAKLAPPTTKPPSDPKAKPTKHRTDNGADEISNGNHGDVSDDDKDGKEKNALRKSGDKVKNPKKT